MGVHRQWSRWSLMTPPLICIVFIVALTLGMPTLADPTKLGECSACHVSVNVLPEGHLPTTDMDAQTCLVCHAKGADFSLRSKMPLGHLHQLSGVTCQNCHGETETPAALSTEQCLACHGPIEALAARTADVRPTNPHSTPHGPTFVACDLCHQAHRKSENFCAQCHDFDFTVP